MLISPPQYCIDLAVKAAKQSPCAKSQRGVTIWNPFLNGRNHNIVDNEMLHVKIENGLLVAGGPPSCLECSKLIANSGLSHMWLFEKNALYKNNCKFDGWVKYTIQDFHKTTLINYLNNIKGMY